MTTYRIKGGPSFNTAQELYDYQQELSPPAAPGSWSTFDPEFASQLGLSEQQWNSLVDQVNAMRQGGSGAIPVGPGGSHGTNFALTPESTDQQLWEGIRGLAYKAVNPDAYPDPVNTQREFIKNIGKTGALLLGGAGAAGAFAGAGGAGAAGAKGATAGLSEIGLPAGVGYLPGGTAGATGAFNAAMAGAPMASMPAGATTIAAGGASPGLFSKLGQMGKNYFVNPDGTKNWGNIIKAGSTAAGAIAPLLAAKPPSQGAMPSMGGPLSKVPLNRTVTGLPKEEDYFTYGQTGGEHQFFSNNQLPMVGGPTTQMASPNFNELPVMRTGGHYILGPGSGRSDDIDAKLSNNEYVMDAETVALLGDGSPDEGARRLDELRANLRRHKGKQLSQGKFSSSAKRPEQYLKLAKGGRAIRVSRTPMIGDPKLAHSAGMDAANRVMRRKGLKEWDDEAWNAATEAFNKVMGEAPVKKAKGGHIRPPMRVVEGGLPAKTEAERRAELEAVQRFLKVFREQNPKPEPRLKLVKAKGGAVENMTRFADELEQNIQAGNSDRITQITAQMDSISPKASDFFKEGFAKGGKAKDLLQQFWDRMNTQKRSGVPVEQLVAELRRLKPDSDTLRLYDESSKYRKPMNAKPPQLRGENLMRLLEGEK